MEIIFNRRSVRKYKNIKVETEKINKLLKAAMQAPSAGNQQPWEFLIIEDKETLNKISHYSPYASFLNKSPLAFILLGNKKRMKFPENWEQDMSAATENILLEATFLELGSVWLGVAPSIERINFIRDFFSLEDYLIPFSIVSIGYPEDETANKFIDRFDMQRIHYEKY